MLTKSNTGMAKDSHFTFHSPPTKGSIGFVIYDSQGADFMADQCTLSCPPVNGHDSDPDLDAADVDEVDIGSHAFSSMQADPDKTKREQGSTRPIQSEEDERKRR